ncbi:MAG: recombinase family protein [Chloroflexota bacterium]|nr:recombinase family protein [Chloroflexota bacterium]
MKTKHAAAYIRRSSVSADSPGDASREAQLAATAKLAAVHCAGLEVREYGQDWGVSGRKDDRKDYLRLKAAIGRGEVCGVFLYSLSRIGRTSRELLSFFDFCDEHGVPVVSQAEGQLTPAATAMARFLRGIMVQMAELESELAKERIRAALDTKRAKGDELGHPPYGYKRSRDQSGRVVFVRDPEVDLDVVLDAVTRTGGNIQRACAQLEKASVPAPRGGRSWTTSLVTRIVDREAPHLRAKRSSDGDRRPTTSPLSNLVRCPTCAAFMTPVGTREGLYCRNGSKSRMTGHVPHAKYFTKAPPIIALLRAETERLGAAIISFSTANGSAAKRAAVQERLGRQVELYGDGLIDRARLDAERARAARALDELADEDEVMAMDPRIGPLVRWGTDDQSTPPHQLNADLRRVFSEVRLDPATLAPIEVVWRRPEWRAPE